MTKMSDKHSVEYKRATGDLYRARERERMRGKPEPAKLVIQLIALAFTLECLKMKIHFPKENEDLIKMVDAGIDVAHNQVSLYYEGRFEVWSLEQVVDAVSGILLRCQAAGLDLGTI
ncbi:hypothetical protein [Silanimonas sp.]|jgi:hypothetical protein|uniref:hypothetical protein n=1 Tax=Silanimonas sp. TaxID=1929290 RepID=UPI0037CA2BE6